jgi:hypothetical protein
MDGSMAASAWATAGIVTFPFLFFVSAPYGKLGRDGWGPRIDGRLGWCLQELPSPLALLYGIYTSNAASSADSWRLRCGARTTPTARCGTRSRGTCPTRRCPSSHPPWRSTW